MQSIMVMSTKGDNMGIFKKIWHWLFGKKEVDKWEGDNARKLEEINALKKEVGDIKRELPKYATGGYIGDVKEYVGYIGDAKEYVGYSEVSKIRREGTKIKGGVNTRPTTPRPNFAPPPQNPPRDFKREADEHFRQQHTRRGSDDNFLMGAMVAYVITDSLNDSPSARDIEVPKSSSCESSYTPSSSSSYDSGSYSSSSDSGSSSSSCDSGC